VVLFQPEGIDRHAGAACAGRAAQHALATGIVDVLFLPGTASIPARQVVEPVVGQRRTGPIDGVGGDVAPGIVEARVTLPQFVTAGRACLVEPGQLVRMGAIAVEIARGGAAIALRSLPQLPQVRVDVAGAIACSAQAIGERAAAAVAVALLQSHPCLTLG